MPKLAAPRSIALLLVLFGVSSTAGARGGPAALVTLTLEAPAACPSPARIRQRVAHLLRQSRRQPQPIRARIRIEKQSDGRYHLELRTTQDGTAGVRRIADRQCVVVTESAALILAMMLDPDAVARQREAPSSSETKKPETKKPETKKPETKKPETKKPETRSLRVSSSLRWEPRLRIGVVGDVGSLPAPAIGGALTAGLAVGRWWGELGGCALAPRYVVAETSESAGADLWLLVGRATLGWTAFAGRQLEINPLAGFEAGAIVGRGLGIAEPRTGSASWAALGGGARAALRLSPALALTLDAELLLVLTRRRFVIEGIGALHRYAPVFTRLSIGAELRL